MPEIVCQNMCSIDCQTDRLPDRLPENMPKECQIEGHSYKVSDRMPQSVSDRIPKKIGRIYVRYCQSRNVGIYVRIHAAVGITRSISFCILFGSFVGSSELIFGLC